mmetsp:Transcript_25500/g.42555  ORF Transcript_25500/g.42555 Transcript_25500/m.42555 type:complete len:347 (+) Transcript_25500:65-1105(+)
MVKFFLIFAAVALLFSWSAQSLRLPHRAHGHLQMSSSTPSSFKGRLAAELTKGVQLAGVAGITAFAASTTNPVHVVAASSVDFDAVRAEIGKIYKADPNKGPTFVRLAWHSSGTYDKMSKTGGSQLGTIRFKEELAHGGNAGLDLAVGWLEPVYTKFKASGLSYADLYTLSGIESIRLMGGPSIGWRAGRVDSMTAEDVTPDGRLPNADMGSPSNTAAHLREIFGRMGFNDQEIVALSGAHALGRCHASASGYEGPWTPTPTSFNNLYFSLLKQLKWTPNPTSKKFQYQDPSGQLMMLPSDIVLLEDAKFKKFVDMYAKDQKLFFKDFAAAFQKLQELGTKNLYDV